MGVYTEDFQNNYVDGEKLLNLNGLKLRELNVHPRHIKCILGATKYYRDHNPENDYEFASDGEDDFEEEEDEEDTGDMDNYTPPDEIEQMTQHIPPHQLRTVRPPPPEQEEIFDESYEVPDAPEDNQPPPPPRPQRTHATANQPPPKPIHTNHTAPKDKPAIQPAGFHRKPPPTPLSPTEPEPAPPVVGGRAFRAAPAPPPESPVSNDRLTSLPDAPAPGPPIHKMSKDTKTPGRPKGTRPPAPLPGEQQPPLPPNSRGHISTEPVVPAGESLDEQLNYEAVDEPQLDYEEVADSTPSSNASTLNRSMARGGPLPKTPSEEEEGSGGSIGSAASKLRPTRGPPDLPRPGTTVRTQYPLVTLPNNASTHTSGSTLQTGKKKVIQSYTDHDIQSNTKQAAVAPPPVVTRPAAPVNNSPAFGKAFKPAGASAPSLPKPPVEKLVAIAKPLPSVPPETSTPSASSDAVTETAGLSVKERMALLHAKNDPVGPKQSSLVKKTGNLMEEMMSKQTDRKNSGIGSKLSSVGQNNTGPPLPAPHHHSPPHPLNGTMGRNAPNASPSHGVTSHSNPSRPPLTHGSPSHVGSSHGSPSHNSPAHVSPSRGVAVRNNLPPALPTSNRPSHRESTDVASNPGSDEDRGMYGYSWYKSNIDRNQSMELLKRHRGDNKGIFIVRKSTRDKSKPYTLDVMYDEHDFHIPLRLRPDGQYAMGTSQADEDHWSSVSALIDYFKTHNLALTRKVDGVTIKRSTLLKE